MFLRISFGGDEEDRTLYLLTASQALSQVSYAPMRFLDCLTIIAYPAGFVKRFLQKNRAKFCLCPKFLLSLLFQLEGAGIQLIVFSLFGNQHLVGTALDDAPVLQYHDDVGVLYGGEQVSDDK